MSANPNSRRTSHRLIDEHARLDEVIAAVRKTVFDRTTSRQAVEHSLEQLARAVIDHFRSEEADGYFAEVLEFAPRLSRRVEFLLGQHPQFTAELIRMLEYARRGVGGESWRSNLREMLDGFLEGFHEHEAAEHGLLQDAYSYDLGTGD